MKLRDDRRGAVAVLVGMVMVGVVAMAAVAMDLTSAISTHARLREAADTAALAAVRQAAIDSAITVPSTFAGAEAAGQQRFMTQASSVPNLSIYHEGTHVV